MSLKFTTIPQKRLLAGITSASTSFYLNNIVSFDGVTDLTPADFGSIHYCAFRNDTGTILELMEIDPSTITAGDAITINKRGLSFYGDLTTQDTDLKLDWPTNTVVMLGTDVPQIFQWLKEYIDGIAIAGAPDATTAIKGLVKMSTAPVSAASPIAVGTNDDRVPVGYAVDSVGTDSYAITPTPAETAYVAGKEYTFKAGTANTGACTLNVSALGAKTIKKDVSTDLATGDILQNQIVVCKYDGTNMQLMSKSSLDKQTDVQTFTSSSTWTKPAGAKTVTIIAVGAGGSGGGGTTGVGGAGAGGGGGAVVIETLDASLLGATETVVCGTGGAAPGGDVNGNNGTASTFGTRISAGGGGGGLRRNGAGGGGGGVGGSASGATGGLPTAASDAIAGQGATGTNAAGRLAEWGGASGGGGGGETPNLKGGSSLYGGGGGGSGYLTTGTGSDGGVSGSYVVGGGGTGANPGVAGNSNVTLGKGYAGAGGGGAGEGYAGGAGGFPGGGGGGGGGVTSGGVGPSGNGGAGANGQVTVITYF